MDDIQVSKKESGGKKDGSGPKPLFILVVVIVIAVAAWFIGKNYSDNNSGAATVVLSADAAALINGEKITRDTLDRKVEQEKVNYEAQGVDFSSDPTLIDTLRKQIIQSMVNQKLVLQDADRRNISVSESEINEQSNVIKGRFETEEAFKEELERAKMTEEEFKNNTRDSLVLEKYVAEVTEGKPVSASEEEIEALYEQMKQSQGEEVPSFEEARTTLENQIRNQKINQEIQVVIIDLRAEGVVKIADDLK
ncbi:MAG: SurA N-terminal domain-containing protein [bacterium]|nr:SurA N-terminal domain-containing protein [bacterium]